MFYRNFVYIVHFNNNHAIEYKALLAKMCFPYLNYVYTCYIVSIGNYCHTSLCVRYMHH